MNTLFPKKARRKSSREEERAQSAICKYIKHQYPLVIFMADIAAGNNMGKKWNGLKSAWRSGKGFPDIYIFEPVSGKYNGLFIELKSDSAAPLKKDGSIRKNEHLETQGAMHIRLRNKGYLALFTTGVNHTIAVIDWYMAGAEGNPPKAQPKQRKLCTAD